MNRSTLPIGLFGVASLASTFHVRSPQLRKRNGPNESNWLKLLALSLVSVGWGLFWSANGFGSPELAMTSPLAVRIVTSSGVFPDWSGILSPTLRVFDLFWL